MVGNTKKTYCLVGYRICLVIFKYGNNNIIIIADIFYHTTHKNRKILDILFMQYRKKKIAFFTRIIF